MSGPGHAERLPPPMTPDPAGPEPKEGQMTEKIKHMVDRFLRWKLPENFAPDGGINYSGSMGNAGTEYEYRRDPTGTNLLDANQAEAMVRFMVEGLAEFAPPPSPPGAANSAAGVYPPGFPGPTNTAGGVYPPPGAAKEERCACEAVPSAAFSWSRNCPLHGHSQPPTPPPATEEAKVACREHACGAVLLGSACTLWPESVGCPTHGLSCPVVPPPATEERDTFCGGCGHPACHDCNPKPYGWGLVPPPPSPATEERNALALAMRFHETYERLAPQFGYETRKDTRAFDPDSPNGKLMVAVCSELVPPPASADARGINWPSGAILIYADGYSGPTLPELESQVRSALAASEAVLHTVTEQRDTTLKDLDTVIAERDEIYDQVTAERQRADELKARVIELERLEASRV